MNKASILIEESKLKETISGLLKHDTLTDEQRGELATATGRMETLQVEKRAALMVEPDETRVEEPNAGEDSEAKELRELRRKIRLGAYIGAAVEMRAANGAELEYNQAIGIGGNRFPLEILAPAEVEHRAVTDTDAGPTRPRRWLDRLFGASSASRLGITYESVEPGTASFPITTAGASGAQRGRTQAAAVTAWTVGVSELKPTRNAVHAIFSIEDAARIPGLEDALVRDLRMAISDAVDLSIFEGDSGANEDAADIVGLKSHANVSETTLTQANKLLWPATVKAFTDLIDGKHAEMPEDLRVVASVGATRLWLSTTANSNRNESVAQIMRANGLTWGTRQGIDTNTANGDFGAFIGRGRGIDGAGVAAVWSAGELIRDPYAGAAKGEIGLTVSYLWGFGLPRPASFARIKFVA